ncbi:MAG: undecaprenyl-diphosphate phosphatase [Bacilli bacterium]|jgi:undecaprenyl-diphosphatase|nr:undecaprenyl-diphosphate phosphatase [Bacilli bacterium]
MNTIKLFQYILLGIIQGFTEPLPISSSGHLVILGHLFKTNIFTDLNFEIMLNFGSLIAIILIYKEDIIKIITGSIAYLQTKKPKHQPDFTYIMLLIIGTIPAGIAGLLFKDLIEQLFINNLKLIGFSLLVTGFLLYIIRNSTGTIDDNKISFKSAFMVGLCQAIALIPGISRSGMTIVGGLLNDFKRSTALKFSFLLYIPVSLGSFMLGINDIITHEQIAIIWLPYLLGTIAATIVTYYTTKLFIKITTEGKLIYFVYYCLVVGSLVLLLL